MSLLFASEGRFRLQPVPTPCAGFSKVPAEDVYAGALPSFATRAYKNLSIV